MIDPFATIDLFGEVRSSTDNGGILARKYIKPPFSVLNAREGGWSDRKRQWRSLGIESEVGRDAAAYNTEGSLKGTHEDRTGISIFDPVLTELIYRWFCPAGGQIVDPFAGGSVRGIVAAKLGYRYWGVDLRPEQVAANREQADRIVPDAESLRWVTGDAMDEVGSSPVADLLFTCPPYGDLEVYSDHPRDLSRMKWHRFKSAYRDIIARACDRLKSGRFAAIVVGDFRDENGCLRDFTGVTIAAFRAAGLPLYNRAVLVTPCGTLPQRITAQFEATRKLGMAHQEVLVFIKGNAAHAAQAIR